MSQPVTLPEILAEIKAAYEDSITPEPLRQALVAFHKANDARIRELHLHLLGAAAEFMHDTAGDYDRDHPLAMRVASVAMQDVTTFIARALKRLQGEELSPARVAIVAFEMARDTLALDWDAADPTTTFDAGLDAEPLAEAAT